MINGIKNVFARAQPRFLVFLAAASYLLYAGAVLLLRQDLAPGWSVEAGGAIPAAVSHLVYGTRLGAVDHAILWKFLSPGGKSVQEVLALAASKSFAPSWVDSTTFDGSGAGTNLFAAIAMRMFGPKILSLVLLYLLMIGVSVVAFLLRFQDKRLLSLPLYFLVVTIMLITPLGTSAEAIDQIPIGGQRYFVLAVFIPALHIFFEFVDSRPPPVLKREILLLVQALLLFGALVVRSSTGYVLIALFAIVIWRLCQARKRPRELKLLWRKTAPVVGAFAVWVVIIMTALPVYVRSNRVLGNFWHRAFISFSAHPDWPFGNLPQVYDCTRYIPEGLNRQHADRNGHCIWWVYPPNAKRGESEVLVGVYGGEYERAMRQAYFYVVTHYPKQAFELYVYIKSQLIGEAIATAWQSLFKLAYAPVPSMMFAVVATQLLVLVAFIASVAIFDRRVIGLSMAIFPLLFLFSLAPLYVAWANYWTTLDSVFLMYSCLVLAIVLLLQLVSQAIVGRAPILPPAS
jgi:hypothetical protein